MAVGTGASVVIDSDTTFNVANYQVVEDSTPLDPSDLSGGFGQMTLGVRVDNETKRLMGRTLTLNDGSMGEITGRIRALDGGPLSAGIRADSRLGQLAVQRTRKPFVGTLANGLLYLFSLCGITTGIDIADELYSVNVKLPGGNKDTVYDTIKRMAAAYQFEVSLISNNVIVRRPRGRIAVNYRNADVKWTLDQSQFARSVSGWYYNTSSGLRSVYPVQGDVDNTQVYQVDAGQVQVINIPLDSSLDSVEQPVCVTSVARYDLSASVYSVSTTDEGVSISPARWLASGGNVSVAIGEDTRSLIVTITGADLPTLAPFRIAVNAESNQYYSSLRIRGTGVHWQREQMTLHLSDDLDANPDALGTDVDVEFMETSDQLYHRLLKTAARYSTDTQTISVDSAGINRQGESGSARYPTIGDVNALYPGETIGSIHSILGPTIADWNATLFALVSKDFDNQAFGNVAGARVLEDNCYYRIRSATISPGGLTYEAERDNLIGDVYRTGETIGEWNSRWVGKTIRDVNIEPLIPADYDPSVGGFGRGGFGTGLFGM